MEIEIWGDGQQTRSFMYIDDCIKGSTEIMESDIREPINLGSAEMVSINQLVDKIVIVKINPKDVVSVPNDCNCEKLRTCRYEVVGEYQGELLKPLYKSEFSEDEYYDEEENLYDEYDDAYWNSFDDDEEDEEDYEDNNQY